MSDLNEAILIAAIMQAAGVTEIEVYQEALVDMPRDMFLTRRYDLMKDSFVFKLHRPQEFVEGEVISPMLPELEDGR